MSVQHETRQHHVEATRREVHPVLIVEGAGGVVVDAFGRPFTLEPDLTLRWSGIAAASADLAAEIAAEIDVRR